MNKSKSNLTSIHTTQKPQFPTTQFSSVSFDYDYLIKLLLIGDSGVGKSSMMIKFSDDMFSEQSIPTIGVDFKIKTIEFAGKIYKIQIWDTAGQERFRTITSSYYRGAQGIVIVYDVTNRDTYDNVKIWLTECERYNNKAKIILVGNKCDLSSKRTVTTEEAEEYAKIMGYKFIETSAKTNKGIDDAFNLMIVEVSNSNMFKTLHNNNNINICPVSKPKKCC